MKNTLSLAAITAALLLCSGAVNASGMGIRFGTTGFGVDVAVPVAYVPGLSARFGVSGLNTSTTLDDTDISYDGRLKMANYSALLDWNWNPLGLFRLTGGLVYADNRMDVTGKPTGGSYVINGNTYPASSIGSLSGSIGSNRKLAPYLGLGWGTVSGAGIGFYGDVGVMIQGAPTTELNVNCGSAIPATECVKLKSDVAKEAQALQESVDGLKFWPVINVGITIGF